MNRPIYGSRNTLGQNWNDEALRAAKASMGKDEDEWATPEKDTRGEYNMRGGARPGI